MLQNYGSAVSYIDEKRDAGSNRGGGDHIEKAKSELGGGGAKSVGDAESERTQIEPENQKVNRSRSARTRERARSGERLKNSRRSKPTGEPQEKSKMKLYATRNGGLTETIDWRGYAARILAQRRDPASIVVGRLISRYYGPDTSAQPAIAPGVLAAVQQIMRRNGAE